MNNKKTFILLVVFFLIPLFVFSQSGDVPDNYKKAVDWAQGGSILEDWFMKTFLAGYQAILWSEYDSLISMARALAGIFTLIYISSRIYEMMAGDKQLEIMPLLKPFGLGLMITFWGSFVNIISLPPDQITQFTARKYDAQQKRVNNLRYERAQYQYSLVNALYTVKAETSLAKEQTASFWDDPLGNIAGSVKDEIANVALPVLELKDKFEIAIQLTVTQALEVIALWLLRICVYGLFVIQTIFLSILLMFGPISIAMSILPMFRDSFSAWIARFISIKLYLAIAFVALFVGGILQEQALTMEIFKYKELVDQNSNVVSMEKLLFFKTSGLLSFGVVIVSFLVTAVTMFAVPQISTWIVSSSGAGGATGGMMRNASKIVKMVATKGLLK